LDGNRTHFLIHYDDPAASWATMYPLAFDRLVGLDTFDTSVAAMQSEWYARNEHPLGMQLTSQITYTLLEWECWAAAISSTSVRDFFIDSIHAEYTSGLNSVPGPTQWNVVGNNVGHWFFSIAKPIVGSTFMIYAVDDAVSRRTQGSQPALFDSGHYADQIELS